MYQKTIQSKHITSSVIGSADTQWLSISCLQLTPKFWQQFKSIYLKLIEVTKGQTCLGKKTQLVSWCTLPCSSENNRHLCKQRNVQVSVCDQSCLGLHLMMKNIKWLNSVLNNIWYINYILLLCVMLAMCEAHITLIAQLCHPLTLIIAVWRQT